MHQSASILILCPLQQMFEIKSLFIVNGLCFRYENRGVQWLNSIPTLPPGLAPDDAVQKADAALSKNAKKRQKRKEKKQQEAVSQLTDTLSEVSFASDEKKSARTPQTNLSKDDIQKKLRAARKKLKEIDNLQDKIDSGEISTPEKNQLAKLSKREQFINEVQTLEKLLA